MLVVESALAVDVFTVTDVRNCDDGLIVIDLVQDSIVAGPQSVYSRVSAQEFDSSRARVSCEAVDPRSDLSLNLLWEVGELRPCRLKNHYGI